MTKTAEQIKKWYETGLWNPDRVRNVVGRPKGITAAEYKAITGEKYPG